MQCFLFDQKLNDGPPKINFPTRLNTFLGLNLITRGQKSPSRIKLLIQTSEIGIFAPPPKILVPVLKGDRKYFPRIPSPQVSVNIFSDFTSGHLFSVCRKNYSDGWSGTCTLNERESGIGWNGTKVGPKQIL